MGILPIDVSPQLLKGVQITDALNKGVPMLNNPLSASGLSITNNLSTARINLSALDKSSLSVSELANVTSFESALSDLETEVSNMVGHVDTVLFGDDTGGPLSGGITSNVGNALSGVDLDDTLGELDGNTALSSAGNACQFLTDLLGSIFGLAGAIFDAITAAIGTILDAIAQGIQYVLGIIGSLIDSVFGFIGEIAQLIADEIQKFLDLIDLNINFGIGSFLSGAGNLNPCKELVIDTVGSPQLKSILM